MRGSPALSRAENGQNGEFFTPGRHERKKRPYLSAIHSLNEEPYRDPDRPLSCLRAGQFIASRHGFDIAYNASLPLKFPRADFLI